MSDNKRLPYEARYGERKVREVQCPFCDHIFMMIEGTLGLYSKDGHSYWGTVCPKCDSNLVVVPGILLGEDTEGYKQEFLPQS